MDRIVECESGGLLLGVVGPERRVFGERCQYDTSGFTAQETLIRGTAPSARVLYLKIESTAAQLRNLLIPPLFMIK